MTLDSTAYSDKLFAFSARLYYIAAGAYYVYQWMIVLGIAATATGLVTWGVQLFKGPPFGVVAALLVGFGLGALFVGLLTSTLLAKQRLDSLNPGLVVTRSEVIYEVLPQGRYRYVMKQEVRAIVVGVTGYRTKLRWTGDGELSCSVSNGALLGRPTVVDVWDVYEVRFPHQLAAGVKHQFALTFEMRDESNTALPFMGKTIDDFYPNGMVIRVVLHESLRSSFCTGTVYPSSRGDVAMIPPKVLTCDRQTGEVKWNIPHPRLGFRYLLRWQQQEVH